MSNRNRNKPPVPPMPPRYDVYNGGFHPYPPPYWHDTEHAVEVPPWANCCCPTPEPSECVCVTEEDMDVIYNTMETVSANSGTWGGNSGSDARNWNSTYSSVSANSAMWNSAYSGFFNNSSFSSLNQVKEELDKAVDLIDNWTLYSNEYYFSGSGTSASPLDFTKDWKDNLAQLQQLCIMSQDFLTMSSKWVVETDKELSAVDKDLGEIHNELAKIWTFIRKGVLEIYHDNTMTGDGSKQFPLSVIQKDFVVSSKTPKAINVVSSVNGNTTTYTLSGSEGRIYTFSGKNGISATENNGKVVIDGNDLNQNIKILSSNVTNLTEWMVNTDNDLYGNAENDTYLHAKLKTSNGRMAQDDGDIELEWVKVPTTISGQSGVSAAVINNKFIVGLTDEIVDKINNMGGYKGPYASLDDIPKSEISNKFIYLIGPKGEGKDKYEEYIWNDQAFIMIGETTIDLSHKLDVSAFNTYSANVEETISILKEDNKGSILTQNEYGVNEWMPVYQGGKYVNIDFDNTINVSGLVDQYEFNTYSSYIEDVLDNLSTKNIVGDSGISANYNTLDNSWHIGIKYATNAQISAMFTGGVQRDPIKYVTTAQYGVEVTNGLIPDVNELKSVAQRLKNI